MRGLFHAIFASDQLMSQICPHPVLTAFTDGISVGAGPDVLPTAELAVPFTTACRTGHPAAGSSMFCVTDHLKAHEPKYSP